MTADDVRAALEEKLGSAFTETTWKMLYRDVVRNYLEDQPSETWRSVRDVAEDLFEYERELKRELAAGYVTDPSIKKRRLGQRESRPALEAAEEHWFPELSRETRLRAEVYGEYLAAVAADDVYVARYRKRVIDDPTATLTMGQAHSLVRSVAAQTLPPGFFRRMRIPVGEHSVELLTSEYDVGGGESVQDYATIRVWWPENPEGVVRRVQSSVSVGDHSSWLEFRNVEGEDDRIVVLRASVLGELQQVASRLTKQFPWREDQATWFVLTGEAPLVPPVKTQYTWHPARVHLPSGETSRFTYGEVTISVAPWVSETIISEAYFNLQRRILSVDQNQPLGRRGLELLRFVLQRESPLGLTRARRRKVGKELVEAWNRKYPNWTFADKKQPTSVFWDAYSDAESQVMHPSWTHPAKLRQTSANGSS